MSKSLMQDEKECLVCGATTALHKHHIFFGTGNRALSEKDGCYCYLCAYHHNMSDNSVHFNKRLDQGIKKVCQIKWEAKYGNREEFIRRYGKSYL